MSTSGERVAVLGLGAMGSRLAARLLAAGHRVTVWNRTSAKAVPLVERGATAAASPAEAVAEAGIAITMLASPDALAAVTEGERGIAGALRPGQTLVEMSTVGPAAIDRLRGALDEGVALVDAPVLGSLAEAEAGELVVFVGGEAEDTQRVEPLLRELGTPLHVGGAGAGAAAKLVANSTLFGVIAVFGEALALADALGLDRETAFAVLSRTPLAAQAERRRDAIEEGAFPPRFALSLARKDAALVTGATTARLPLAEAALSWLVAAEEAGDGERDYSAVLATILGQRRP